MDVLAPQVVGNSRQGLMAEGRTFYKMSGSGNDFVFFDLKDGPAGKLEDPDSIRSICARGTGVGADGVVFLERGSPDSFSIRYYNSDGSLGELCGNATLCSLRLAKELGAGAFKETWIHTDAGAIRARMADGLPEIDLAPVTEVRVEVPEIPKLDREDLLGFARAGVPHIVIVDENVETADILGRGSKVRCDRSLHDGANINFVTKVGDEWVIRTYERGVEGETLACGTGAVATGILLTEWGRARSPVRLQTRSGRRLEVTVRKEGSAWKASLKGPAEIVFVGQLRDLEL